MDSETIPVEIRVGGGGGGWGSLPANAAVAEYYCGECGDRLEETENEGTAILFHSETTVESGFLGLGSKRSEQQCRYAEKYCEKPKIIFRCKVVTP